MIKFQILVGFEPKRAKICRCLVISFGIINDFHQPIKLALHIIKISFLNKKSLIIHENYQNFQVSIKFSTKILMNSLDSGASGSRSRRIKISKIF